MANEIELDEFMTPEEPDTAEERSRKVERQNELNDLRWLIATKAGRNIVNRLLEQTRIYHPSVNTAAPELTLFNEGKRHDGLWLIGELREAVVGRDEDEKNFDKLMREYWRK